MTDYTVRITDNVGPNLKRFLRETIPAVRHETLFNTVKGAEAQAREECPKDTLNLRDGIHGTVNADGMGATLQTENVRDENGFSYAAAVHEKLDGEAHEYQNPTTPGTKPKFIEDPHYDWGQKMPTIAAEAYAKHAKG